jgi:hypothetical protein
MTLEPNLESWEEPEVAQSEIWRIWWLGDGWDFILHQNVLHCEGFVTWCIVMVQDQVVSPQPIVAH